MGEKATFKWSGLGANARRPPMWHIVRPGTRLTFCGLDIAHAVKIMPCEGSENIECVKCQTHGPCTGPESPRLHGRPRAGCSATIDGQTHVVRPGQPFKTYCMKPAEWSDMVPLGRSGRIDCPVCRLFDARHY